MKASLKNYENFIGKLTEIKPSFIKGLVILVLSNDEKTVKVRYGVVGSKLLEIGEYYTIGHINKRLINIRSGKCKTDKDI